MIEQMKLTELVANCKGQILGDDTDFVSVSIDTRTLKKGALFVALQGKNFDGHQFLEQAKQKHAAAAVISQDSNVEMPLLRVSDTEKYLGKIGALNREIFAGKLVAITGSNGKTTVKEMLASILKEAGEVFATEGNYNNQIGLPLMLTQIESHHDFAVLELGMNAPGEIAYLVELAKPDIAILTNASSAHIASFGTVDAIAREKGDIFSALKPKGIAIINLDDDFADLWLDSVSDKHSITFSLDNYNADFYVETMTLNDNGCYDFVAVTPQGQLTITLSLPGKHNIANALAAMAAAISVGANLEQIKLGLEKLESIQGRLSFYSLNTNFKLIDDTYNASPNSVCAAIDVLAQQNGKKILVLGDMAELGEASISEHKRIGEYAKNNAINLMFTVGEHSRYSAKSFGGQAEHFNFQSDLINRLDEVIAQDKLKQDDIAVLVKGSRLAKMENVVNTLQTKFADGRGQ